MESSALAIDTWLIGGMELVATAQANVEALAARQQELDICLNGGGNQPMPMMAADKKAKDHCLPDCRDVLAAMKEEISMYFAKIIRKVRGQK